MKIPGNPTIPEMIIDNRAPYYDALEQADRGSEKDAIALGDMESLIESLLAKQLLTVVSEASGKAY